MSAVFGSTAALAQQADQPVIAVETYWVVVAAEGVPGSTALTWVGAQDGAEGPSQENALAAVSVHFRPSEDGDDACEAEIEISIRDAPPYQLMQVWVDEVDQTWTVGEDTNQAVIYQDEISSLLDAFAPGSTVHVRLEGWKEGLVDLEYTLSLYGFSASIETALALCEEGIN